MIDIKEMALTTSHEYDKTVFLKHYCTQKSIGWGLRFCISNKLSGDADATGSWTTYE